MGPKNIGGLFSLPCGRIVVTATSPARIVTKASHRRNGTQRMSLRAAAQPFTADCMSLDMIGDIGTRSRPSNVVVSDGGPAICVCCPLNGTQNTRRLPEHCKARTHRSSVKRDI